MSDVPDDGRCASEDWWRTATIDMAQGVIRYRGYVIEELTQRRTSLAQMIWLMTRGELPYRAQGALLEAALMSAVDHGPQAPSIAIARMAVTCGVGLNSAMSSAVNVLGSVHSGAGEQAVELYLDIAARVDAGAGEADAVRAGLDAFVAAHGKVVPGFARRARLVSGRFASCAWRQHHAASRPERCDSHRPDAISRTYAQGFP